MSSLNGEKEKGHGNDWRQWLGHLKDVKAVGIEVGTFKGESAEWMLENIFTHPDSFYVCIDLFTGSSEHHLAGIDCSTLLNETMERLAKFGKRKVVIKGASNVCLREYTTEIPVDFVYIDAAHDAQNVLRDAVLAFDLLKVGGVMIFDDYEWNVFPDALDCPKLAIDSFLACYARQIEIIGLGWQVAIKKVK